jgi:hypothetical protein
VDDRDRRTVADAERGKADVGVGLGADRPGPLPVPEFDQDLAGALDRIGESGLDEGLGAAVPRFDRRIDFFHGQVAGPGQGADELGVHVVEDGVEHLAVRGRHGFFGELFAGRLVLADLLDLHLDVQLGPDPAEKHGVCGQAREERRRGRRDVDLVGHRREVEFLAGGGEFDFHFGDDAFALGLDERKRRADLLDLGPAGVEAVDAHHHAGDAPVVTDLAQGFGEVAE